MKRERNLYIDIVKGLCIILVIIGHCIQYGSGNKYLEDNTFFNNPFFIFIYSFHMPLFMLISGYLFAYSINNKKWNKVLITKINQLIIPLFAWSFISLIITISKSIPQGTGESLNIIWIIKKILSNFIYGPWFLWAIWWCSLAIIIVKTFLKDSKIIYILITIITFILPDILNLSLYKFMWPFFLLAYMFNTYDWKNKLKPLYNNKFFIIAVSITFVILLIFFKNDYYIYISGYTLLNKNILYQLFINIYRFAIGISGSISILYLLYAIEKIMPNILKEGFAYIGKNTMGIYIISSIIFTEFLPLIIGSLNGINYFYILIETLSILLVSIILTLILKKFKITNILFLGGR